MRTHFKRFFPFTRLRTNYILGPRYALLDGWGGRCSEFFGIPRKGQTIPLANKDTALLHPSRVEDVGCVSGDTFQSIRILGKSTTA